MNYSKNYFGKNLSDLKYSDIEDFFLESKEETNNIEFKSYSATHSNFNEDIKGIIKGICAFLNSDGGILIWGAPEGRKVKGRKEKIFIGDLSPVIELREKDQLISQISDSITPLPVGVNVQPLNQKESYLYVFEVQRSKYSPHQFKNIYFARLDGQTVPAPHYLIEALFKKITYPNIEGYIRLDKIFHNYNDYYLNITIFIFNFSELQNEENVSFKLTCPQGIFTKSQTPEYQKMYLDGNQLIHKGLIDVLHFGAPYMHTEKLIFNPNKVLSEFENKVELLLSFGGKKSPLKSSKYELDFSKIKWNMQDNPSYLIDEKDENVLSSELQKKLNNKKEDTLRIFLKRS